MISDYHVFLEFAKSDAIMLIIKRNYADHNPQPVDFIDEGTPNKERTTLVGGSASIKIKTGAYEGLEITDANGTKVTVRTDTVTSTQVEPTAAAPFTGTTQDLKDLLKEFFFFNVAEPTPAELYDSIVDASGEGDYLLLSAALAAGETSIYIKNGTYIETADCEIVNDYTSITGESIGGVKIIMKDSYSIKTTSNTVSSAGTISITTNTKIVTLAAASFPATAVDQRILLNNEFYAIASRDSSTQLTLKNEYKGRTISAGSYKINKFYSGIQLQNFSVIGTDEVTVSTVDLFSLYNLYNSYAENLFISTTETACFRLQNSANCTVHKCIAWNAGNDAFVGSAATGFIINGNTIKVTACSGSNNGYAGIFPQGENITIENGSYNNNKYGAYISVNTESQYIFDSVTFDSNTLNNIFTGAGVNSITMTNCTVSNCQSIGAYFQGEGVTLTGNVFLLNATATRIKDNSVLTSNTFRLNTGNVVHIEGTNVTVTANTIDGGNNGFYINNSTNCIFTKNRVSNCTDGFCQNTSGDNNRFEGNNANNCSNGFRIVAAITGATFIDNDTYSNTTDYNDLGTTSLYVLNIPITAAQASALPVSKDGSKAFVTTTDATFLTIGYWIYEGSEWRKVLSAPTLNEGQVKLNTGNSLKPSYTWGGIDPPVGTWQQITYASPLGLSASPVTEWPQNITSPTDADLYDSVNDTFIENTVLGQVNFWRVILAYSGKAGNIAAGIEVRIQNTLSGFLEVHTTALPRTSTTGCVALVLATIADAASLPAPFGTGQGYEFSLNSTDDLTLEVDSIARINYQKNPR